LQHLLDAVALAVDLDQGGQPLPPRGIADRVPRRRLGPQAAEDRERLARADVPVVVLGLHAPLQRPHLRAAPSPRRVGCPSPPATPSGARPTPPPARPRPPPRPAAAPPRAPACWPGRRARSAPAAAATAPGIPWPGRTRRRRPPSRAARPA